MANTITSIALCNVPITPTNQIDFPNIEAQKQYFMGKGVHVFFPCKYQARTGKIRVKGYVETFNNCNYGYYTNTYNGVQKTFYFWIVQKNALARETTELTIQLDVFQTWLFDVNMKECFIEREHVADDGLGINTYPEDFELGEYVTVNRECVTEMQGETCFFVAVTDSDTGDIGGLFANNYSGFRLLYYSQRDYQKLTDYITSLCNAGKGDAIAFIFQFPDAYFKKFFGSMQSGQMIEEYKGHFGINVGVSAVEKFKHKQEEYTPKNKKLLTYPYRMLSVSAPNGGNTILKYENFIDKYNRFFAIESCLTQNPTFSATPSNYNGKEHSYEDTLECQCFGLCSWNNDNFANWYAQHSASIRAQSDNNRISYSANNQVAGNNYNTSHANNIDSAIQDGVNAVASTAKSAGAMNFVGAGADAVAGASNTFFNYSKGERSNTNDLSNSNLMNTTNYSNTVRSIMASVSDASVQPNTAKGDTSGSGLDVARNTATFFFNEVAIKPEYAKKIDMFFQMYGYQVNEVKVPNTKTRKRWNYIKTVNATVMGTVPLEDRQAIEDMYDNGLTIWHDESYMYQYSATNTIV